MGNGVDFFSFQRISWSTSADFDGSCSNGSRETLAALSGITSATRADFRTPARSRPRLSASRTAEGFWMFGPLGAGDNAPGGSGSLAYPTRGDDAPRPSSTTVRRRLANSTAIVGGVGANQDDSAGTCRSTPQK